MHITRPHPFHSLPATPPPAKPAAQTPPTAAALPSSGSGAQESFISHFQSAMPPANAAAPAAITPAPAPNVTAADFDAAPLDSRDAAVKAMLTAIGSNDVKGYQQAAANFLAACPAGSTLPVWTRTITLDRSGNLINTNYAGVAFDGTEVSANYTGYAGMRNPVAGQPNIADGTSNSLGDAFGVFRTT